MRRFKIHDRWQFGDIVLSVTFVEFFDDEIEAFHFAEQGLGRLTATISEGIFYEMSNGRPYFVDHRNLVISKQGGSHPQISPEVFVEHRLSKSATAMHRVEVSVFDEAGLQIRF